MLLRGADRPLIRKKDGAGSLSFFVSENKEDNI